MNSIWTKVKPSTVKNDSAVEFPTKTRFHIALNVKDVTELKYFYNNLFGKEPHTERDGYIKYDLEEPPLNISLNRVQHNAKGNGNFGIQAKDSLNIEKIESRLKKEGIKIHKLNNGSGIKVKDPEGNQWSITSANV